MEVRHSPHEDHRIDRYNHPTSHHVHDPPRIDRAHHRHHLHALDDHDLGGHNQLLHDGRSLLPYRDLALGLGPGHAPHDCSFDLPNLYCRRYEKRPIILVTTKRKKEVVLTEFLRMSSRPMRMRYPSRHPVVPGGEVGRGPHHKPAMGLLEVDKGEGRKRGRTLVS